MDLIAQLHRFLDRISDLKPQMREGFLQLVPDRLAELRRLLNSCREIQKSDEEDFGVKYEEFAVYLSTLEDEVEKVIAGKKKLNFTLSAKRLGEIADAVHSHLLQVRETIGKP